MPLSLATVKKAVDNAFLEFQALEAEFSIVGVDSTTFDIATGAVTTIPNDTPFSGILYNHEEKRNVTAGDSQSGQNATITYKLVTKASYFDGLVLESNSIIKRVVDDVKFRIVSFSVDPSNSIVTYSLTGIKNA